MKKFLALLSAVFIFLVLVIVGFIGYSAYVARALDASSKAWVESNVPEIVSTWSKDELLRRSAPDLIKVLDKNPEQLDSLFQKLSKFGPMKSFSMVKGGADISFTTRHGKVKTASYTGVAKCKNGDARISVGLVWAFGEWKFLSFRVIPVYPPFILKKYSDQKPTMEQKKWALATCAILEEYNSDRYDLLGGSERTSDRIKRIQKMLAIWWGIKNRRDLFDTLRWIEEGGHRKEFDDINKYVARLSKSRINTIKQQVASNAEISNKLQIVLKYHNELGSKSIAGWDFVRYISLCGWGYVAGYITEEEAWKTIMPAAQLLQRTFSSWSDLGENYLIGREFWSQEQTARGGQRMWQCYQKLLSDPASPWVSIAWSSSLAPGWNPGSVLNHYRLYWLSILRGIFEKGFRPSEPAKSLSEVRRSGPGLDSSTPRRI